MAWERLTDESGRDTDSQGIPYNESFTEREGKRLKFLRRLRRDGRIGEPPTQETIPPDRRVTVVDPHNVTSLQAFVERHRRGPYRRAGDPPPRGAA